MGRPARSRRRLPYGKFPAVRRTSRYEPGPALWLYRGFTIAQWNNNLLNDPEIRGYQYNVYRSLDDYKRGSSLDILSTMKNAKAMIDGLILQESQLQNF